MCGLAGFIGPGDRSDLAAMAQAIAHRGPDGEGTYTDETRRLHLAHRRLAILDLEGGHQPMWDAGGEIGVVYNGEIYNHRELRLELEARGHRFASDHSDTEVLIHGFREWGEDLPARLNGMFAFAIYEKSRARLFLARDRFGEKPLYVARQGDLFLFASELSAIAAHSRFQARLCPRSVQKFFAHGFLPAPNAILQNCEKLPQGHAMWVDAETLNARTFAYWRFALTPDSSWLQRPEADLVEELRALLFQAVERRLMADVPLGFFLSGGVDSSAVLASAAGALNKDNLKTFTIGFEEESFDESGHAAHVARAIGAPNSMERLDLASARDLAPGVLARMDDALGDASLLPTFLLSRFTRRHVKVALSGDAGDELFAGYDPFQALAPAQAYQALMPRVAHDFLRARINRLPASARNMSLEFKLKRTLSGLSHRPALWNPVWLSPLAPDGMAEIFENPLPAEELYSEALAHWEKDPNASFVDRTLSFYTNLYLPDDILMKVDRAAMMNSLEARAAMLDNDLVAFCQRLPHQWKFRGGVRKYLLKKAVAGLLPKEIVSRPKKGFGVPTALWLKSMPAEPPLAPIAGVRMDKVAGAWASHRAGHSDHRLFLWSWLALQALAYPGAGPAR